MKERKENLINIIEGIVMNDVVKKKVVRKKRVVKKKVLMIKGGGNRGIGDFCRSYIMEKFNKGKELDIKELDKVLEKKFGKVDGKYKNSNGSRIKSIRWYINDLRNSGKFS